jgi:6-phosphogluconolactonase
VRPVYLAIDRSKEPEISVSEPQLLIHPPERFAGEAAAHLATTIGMAVAARGECSLALAGGRTPEPVYEHLAAEPLVRAVPWESVRIFFGDERAVAPDDPASNYAMVKRTLLDHVTPGAVHRMEADRTDRDAAARDYSQLLPDQLDVLLLGVGTDGHTASLFPGSDALQERLRRVVPVTGPFVPHHRLTITPPVITAARQVLVLVAGPGKAAVVSDVLGPELDIARWPAQLAGSGTWILDTAAASGLPQQG